MSERGPRADLEQRSVEAAIAFTTTLYDALQRARFDFIDSPDPAAPIVSRVYSGLMGDLLVRGIQLTTALSESDLSEIPGSLDLPILRSFRGWSNFPTWAMSAWLCRDEQTMTYSCQVVRGAGDVLRGGEWLSDDVAAQLEESSYLDGTADALNTGLQLVAWPELGAYFAPADWEGLGGPSPDSYGPPAPPEEMGGGPQ